MCFKEFWAPFLFVCPPWLAGFLGCWAEPGVCVTCKVTAYCVDNGVKRSGRLVTTAEKYKVAENLVFDRPFGGQIP